ncbi:MAG: replication-associated recombination protein A [Nanoarchaeota archaeon]|nr:replication-associated recombination protein A [Nanoarchaeota archaeon]
MKKVPLAHLMRPRSLDEFVGQEHLVAEGKPLRKLIESGELNSSIILWGPPGCGKTTLARLMSRLTGSEFMEMSAVSASKDDIRKVINKSRLLNTKIVLFLDEIHRFNKAQQDFLLPYVEKGVITLIGATTENPSFEVISALLSRSRVFVLNSLTLEEIEIIVLNAFDDQRFPFEVVISRENVKLISQLSNGDARTAFNILEMVGSISGNVEKEDILDAVQKSHLRYDKNGEEHYNIISAMHKSMRDSDVQGAVYWVMRMVLAGEDPKYIIRRMIRFASEDIGVADSNALLVAIAGKNAVEFLGYPECDCALIQTAIYLANAPKSNSVYEAVKRASKDINETGNLGVPLHLRNAETKLMKDLDYGKGYKYAHNFPDAKVEQEHLPKELRGKKYWELKNKHEKKIE